MLIVIESFQSRFLYCQKRVSKERLVTAKKLFREIRFTEKVSKPTFPSAIKASIHYAIRHQISRNLEATRYGMYLSDRSEICQVNRQHSYRGACRIPERSHYFNIQSRGFETSRDLIIRRLQFLLVNKESQCFAAAIDLAPSRLGTVRTYETGFAYSCMSIDFHKWSIVNMD